MRRILRKISSGEADQLGDVSTLADPSVVETLIDLIGKHDTGLKPLLAILWNIAISGYCGKSYSKIIICLSKQVSCDMHRFDA